jgi:type I restriction enzyme S subunit
MGLKVGYKHTELGDIPTDWEVWPVKRMGEVITGKALAAWAPGRQRPYLRTKNVFDGYIDISDVLTMPMSDAQFAQFMVQKGDLLLNEGQSLELVGRCAMYRNEYAEDCAIQNQLLRFRVKPGTDRAFACQLFRRCQHTGVFARIALQTTSIAHLGGKRFENLQLAWPSTEDEQKSIGVALDDADYLIERLDRLIAKKRDLKQAAMQQLLTGRTRLPGFRGKWKLTKLGDHVTYLSHATHARAVLTTEGTVRYLHYGDVHAAPSIWLDPRATPMPFVPERLAARFDRLESGDLVFVDASEDLTGIGKSVELRGVEGMEIIAGLHTITARFDKSILADGFKGYLQLMPSFKAQLQRLAAGTKVYASNKGHVSSVEIELPGVDEQAAIAEALNDLAAEIASLEARREKTKVLKTGMMQELLTGRTRLVKTEAVPC